ncbi:hypothetical protein NDU88_002943 [Pleurodeles waltl]|uniref:Uncharacterized protein n=1 Tax=Pleurodeles waltl TaxID=8319 RepID=A0AAV7MX46_PLEWA|nr:hypothetical protein NDU88_002943 [Pleurodeles waltl]
MPHPTPDLLRCSGFASPWRLVRPGRGRGGEPSQLRRAFTELQQLWGALRSLGGRLGINTLERGTITSPAPVSGSATLSLLSNQPRGLGSVQTDRSPALTRLPSVEDGRKRSNVSLGGERQPTKERRGLWAPRAAGKPAANGRWRAANGAPRARSAAYQLSTEGGEALTFVNRCLELGLRSAGQQASGRWQMGDSSESGWFFISKFIFRSSLSVKLSVFS